MSYLLMPFDELQTCDILGDAAAKVSTIKIWVESMIAEVNTEMPNKLKDYKKLYVYSTDISSTRFNGHFNMSKSNATRRKFQLHPTTKHNARTPA